MLSFFVTLNSFLVTLNSLLTPYYTSSIVSDKVSHPYKTTGKSIFLYILICVYFWVTNWKTRDSALTDSKHSLTSFCS